MKANKEPRLSHASLIVLRMFMEQPRCQLAGSDITKQSHLMSGTLYPILARLERVGWLKSQWEALNPSEEGRPRKRLYAITGVGYNKALKALQQLGLDQGVAEWTR